MNAMQMTAAEIVKMLGMERHPEGGWFVETFRDVADDKGRSFGTAIYYLLEAGERSHWHKVDAAEIWHFYAGAPLILSISETETGPRRDLTLGPDLAAGQQPQLIVPPDAWQMARSTGAHTLVGCTVSPGFLFERFTLALPGFDIP